MLQKSIFANSLLRAIFAKMRRQTLTFKTALKVILKFCIFLRIDIHRYFDENCVLAIWELEVKREQKG
jgi:hypothetical protein